MAETKERLSALFEDSRPVERIAKRMARAGLCSRRDAERWIEAGRVSVDGKTLETPAVTVGETSVILVDDKPIPEIEPPRLWRYHKDRGVLTTDRDPEGRRTLAESLPKDLPRVVSIGRLDFDSEGLLLLTNDGELSRYLELPTTGWVRRYRVRVYGELKEKELKALANGVTVDGVRYGPVEVTIDKASRTNSWLTVGIREGKNREIRKVMEHIGLTVSRLLRVSYGPFQLGDLEPGQAAEIKRAVLKDQLGLGRSEDDSGRAKARAKPPMRPGRGRGAAPKAAGESEPAHTPRGKGGRPQAAGTGSANVESAKPHGSKLQGGKPPSGRPQSGKPSGAKPKPGKLTLNRPAARKARD
ncbi:MAG: pseudouridine synthase [Alphaproteobacteria bacterium]|nr:pseudouridine synthase [Alphaproteobacteria bacterium]